MITEKADNKISIKEALNTYKQSKKNYLENIERLKTMEGLVLKIDKDATLVNKIRKAISQGHLCVKRIDSLINSIEDNDLRHLESQSKSLMAEISSFGSLSREINNEIRAFRASVIGR